MLMVSPRKTSPTLSLIHEEEKMNPKVTKSCESLYSNRSANLVYRRKQADGTPNKIGGVGARQPAIIPATNEVRQRVLSARRLRMKTFQNQLADAQQTIAELAHENRILRTLHKRQDSALSKYESTNAELPQLLHSHAEELRVWQTKYRNLQAVNKDLEHKLKQKEATILSLSDQNKYYIQLNKDKNLEDRQRLTEKLQLFETRLQEKDNDIKMMARKTQLETKLYKQQLQMEQRKTKDVLMKLEKARLELSGLRKLEEFQLHEKFNITKRNKGINNEVKKEDKDMVKFSFANNNDEEVTDDMDALTSQRSSSTINNMQQITTRPIKNYSIKNQATVQIPKHLTPRNKSILKNNDQGDGDASNVHDIYKTPNSFYASVLQKQHSNLSSITKCQPEKLEDTDYKEEDEYENDNGEEEDDEDELDNKESSDNISDTNINDNDADINGEFVTKIDEGTYTDGTSTDNNNDDDFEEIHKEKTPSHGTNTNMKEEISNIRKQISDDYKEREAFLDTFCRQATNGILRDEAPKKRNSIATDYNVPSNRKHKLLAALKAIDDNKSQD